MGGGSCAVRGKLAAGLLKGMLEAYYSGSTEVPFGLCRSRSSPSAERNKSSSAAAASPAPESTAWDCAAGGTKWPRLGSPGSREPQARRPHGGHPKGRRRWVRRLPRVWRENPSHPQGLPGSGPARGGDLRRGSESRLGARLGGNVPLSTPSIPPLQAPRRSGLAWPPPPLDHPGPPARASTPPPRVTPGRPRAPASGPTIL